MRAPTPSEPKSTFPTYQVPQVSAMRGSAPPVTVVQVARAIWGPRAEPPMLSNNVAHQENVESVINGSSCRISLNNNNKYDNSNIRMLQSVNENYCLLNSVTVPKIQRIINNNYNNNIIEDDDGDEEEDRRAVVIDAAAAAASDGNNTTNVNAALDDTNNADTMITQHNNNNNNSDKLDCKFGALSLGRDIPYQKSDDLEVLDDEDFNMKTYALKNENLTFYCHDNCSLFEHDISNTKYNDQDYHFNVPLRLRGGGESSLSTGTSGWGTPPSQQASNNNANNTSGWGTANPANQTTAGTQQWNSANRQPNANQGQTQEANKANSNMNANGQQTPTSPANNTSWGQPAKAANPPNVVPPPATTSAAVSAAAGAVPAKPAAPAAQPPPSTSTKQQLEQLTNMREAIFSQDGWGGQHVNQDTHWDIPGSPEPQIKMDTSGNAGGTSAPPPWKPTVNNGTELWETNLRNGGQPPPQPQQKTPWGHTPSTNIGGTWGEDDDTDSSNMWTGVPGGNQQQWGSGGGGGGSAGAAPGAAANPMWGNAQKKDPEWGGGQPAAATAGQPGWGDPRGGDPRAAIDPRDIRPDLREIRAGSNDPMRLLDPREQMRLGNSDMRGDPRGITGRLNGAGADAFWTQSGGPTQHLHHANKMAPGGPGNGAGAGWEEPSPPTQRRNMPNYDDGTSLWGNPGQQGGGNAANMVRNSGGVGGGGPPGMAPSRIKPDGSVWCHGRNGSWDETGGGAGVGGGGAGGAAGWEEPAPWNKPKMPGAPLWDNENDWGHKQGPKPALTKEMIWNSKGFRMLVDMGYKKEDVEAALRRGEMNFEDALDMLGSARNTDTWRNRHDDHFEHQQYSGRGYPGGPPGQMPFPPGGSGPNILNNMNAGGGGGGPGNSLINNISPAVVQKMLTQSAGSQGYGGASARSNMQPQSQPSTQQLRMLVQQIQMAVQAGYLNHQILNQPLAPQTLILLNQLLQQIKTLQQLMNQQAMAQSQCGKPNNNALLQCSVLITKTKQQITNLQNQIAAQQAIYVKQQSHGGLGGGPDLFKGGMHDSINALQGNFADLAMKEQNQPQSRLNQWINKDKEDGEFSRAPGSSSKPLNASPNINPLGLTQADGPWSTGRSGDGGGWPETGGGDSADVKDAQWSTPAQPSLTDLVPEFEPGKPWKGNQIKSIEDDPSITPGSVLRPPLTIKEPEMYNVVSNKSPPADSTLPLSLSSSTWSFNPPSSTTSAFSSFSPQSKLPSANKVIDPSAAVNAELWGAPKRGPPPGLSAKGGATLANGWAGNLGGGGGSWGVGAGGQRSSGSWSGSPWLLLRNLTAQIDGSTLRTLCMQHGPLQSFHLYLHQGFALAKYSSREEATKAQTALNNCVLGNTTILAENPCEWDASALLQQVANQQGGSGGGWRSGAGAAVAKQPSNTSGAGGDTWSTGWSNNQSSASLWGSSTLDSADGARATPSSLNSYLPGDLLGGESM